MQILWANKIGVSSLSASSVKDGYSVESLKSYHLSKPFAFDGNSGNVVIDMLSPVSVKDFSLLGTNAVTGAAITLEANASDVWTSPSYSTALTLYPNGIAEKGDINESYRFWRVVMSDSSVTDLKIGYIYIGNDRLQLPGMDPSIELNYNNTTAVSFSATQQTYSDTGIDYFSSKFKFPMVTDYEIEIDGKALATREDILEFWGYNKGARPIILRIFENSLDVVPPFLGVVAQNTLRFKLDRTMGFYGLDFSFLETR
jgi:hypothetical protein